MSVCMSVWGALVSGRASGVAAPGGSVQGQQNEEINNYWAKQREIQEMWYFTVHNFCWELWIFAPEAIKPVYVTGSCVYASTCF